MDTNVMKESNMSLSNSFSSVFTVDGESGRYTVVLKNPTYCSFAESGEKWDDFVTRYAAENVPEEEREALVRELSLSAIVERIRSREEKGFSYDFTRQKEGGELADCHLSVICASPEDNCRRLLCTIQDVTAEKQLEKQFEEMRRTKEIHDFSISGTELFLWELDLVKDQITFADNPFTLKRKKEIGYPDVVPHASRYIMANVMPESVATMQRIFDDIHAGKSVTSGDIHFRAGGDQGYTVCRISYRVLTDENGTPIKAYGCEQNITDQVVLRDSYGAMSARFESEDARKSIFRLCVSLTQNKIISAIPDSFTILKELSYDEALKRPYFMHTYLSDGRRLNQLLDRGTLIADYANGQRHGVFDYRYPGQAEWKWIRADVNLVQNPANSDIELFLFCEDVTESKMQSLIVQRLTTAVYDHIGVINVSDGSYMLQGMDGMIEHDAPHAYAERVENLLNTRILPEHLEETRAAFDMDRITSELEHSKVYMVNTVERQNDGSLAYKLRQYTWLDETKTLLFVSVSDVTANAMEQMRQAEEAEKLIKQVERDTQILQQASIDAYDFIAVIDVEDETITLRSGSWFNLDVPTPEHMRKLPYNGLLEFIAKNYSLSDDEGRAFYQKFAIASVMKELETKREVFFPFDFLDATNKTRVKYKQFRFTWLDKEKGKILASRSDVTTAMEKEKELNLRLQDALTAAQAANAAKSDFLSRMSHDIRTPMNAIIGFSSLLLKDASDAEKVQDQARKILSSSNHLLGLINDILDMSKIESGNVQMNVHEFKLSETISMIDSIVRPLMESKKQTFDIYTTGLRQDSFVADSQRLQQVLLNVLSNATKYTGEGGRIVMNVKSLPETSGHYETISFEVSDNGRGMTEEYQKVIFEPFSREQLKTQEASQGTGLGMAITKNLVNMMGGTISLKSKLGEGSTFTIVIPLHLPEEKENLEFWKNHSLTHMLVVDDEAEVCHNVTKTMEGLGVRMDSALSGEEALTKIDAARQTMDDYHIALLDWKMPGMDGVETARRIRQDLGEEIMILILTAYDYTAIRDEALAAGVDGFISKPFFTESFRRTVEEVRRARHEDDGEAEAQTRKVSEDEVFNSLEGLHILAAEDNELNAEILSEVLKLNGATVDIEPNGAEVADRFRNAACGEYDLVLMDVQMPVMNGYEATRAIRTMETDETLSEEKRAESKAIPIIAMTANAFSEDVQEALNSGMNSHVAKPLNVDVLKKTIQQVKHNNG